MRKIVRTNRNTTVKKFWFIGEEKEILFERPELILTQDAATRNENAYLNHVITPDAIKLFLKLNRKWFLQPDPGALLQFDPNETSNEPMALEAKLTELTKDNFKIVDYVSKPRYVFGCKTKGSVTSFF